MFSRAITFLVVLFGASSELPAQTCGYVGQEFCQSSQTYRCEKTGSELTPIFQNRPCTVSVPPFNGTWRGTGHQSPADVGGADWSIVMTISESAASIDYPSIGCGGSLKLLLKDRTSARYRESITFGQQKCIDGGLITVRLVNGNLVWTWFGEERGEQINAVAVLTR